MAKFRRDKDVVESVRLMGEEVAAKDKASTPGSDQISRLLYGHVQLVLRLPEEHFVIVVMRFLFCRARGCKGIWADTVGNLVSL